jgi:5'-methylthioadenosine phosphorylase
MENELIGIIGGTGLGDVLAEQLVDVKPREIDTPFGKPSGPVLIGGFGQKKIAFINRHGPGHKLNPSKVPYTANIFALKKLGVHTVIATGAAGSLKQTIKPAELVLVDQFIDKTFKRQNTFFEDYGAVHCEMAEPVCARLCTELIGAAKNINVKTHPKGTYVCMEGPQFSTKAESLMHKGWGGDLIGMTALPEAKLAREAQICYALIALVSDYDCWRPHKKKANKQTLLQEIIGNLQGATDNCLKLIKSVLQRHGKLVNDKCPCRKSLELAVWTDRNAIEPDEKQRFKVLFE